MNKYHICTTTCVHTHSPYFKVPEPNYHFTLITEPTSPHFNMPYSRNDEEMNRVLETFFQPYMQEEEYNRLRKSFGLPVILEGEVIDEWFE